MTKIFQCGTISLKEYSQRKDGQWFVRYQQKTSYGYQWGVWKKTTYCPEKAYPVNYKKARLPKD